jgi:hypothetical protein
MTVSGVSRHPVEVNRGLLVGGAVLLAVGGVLGATGLLVGTFAVVSATRKWVDQLETPPSETARQKLHQAKVATSAATSAAADAWRGEAKSKATPA